MSRLSPAFTCAVVALLSTALRLAAQTYALTNLGTLPGSIGSEAISVNSSGQVAGRALFANQAQRGLFYSGGQLTAVDLPNGFTSGNTNAISASGTITGYVYNTVDSPGRAFVWANGVTTLLPTPTGYAGAAGTGINSLGQVVGNAFSNSWETMAFVYSNGVSTPLGTLPGGTGSLAAGINASGQILGTSFNGQIWDGRTFVYSNGIKTVLAPVGMETFGMAINDAGQVTGLAFSADFFGKTHAYIYTPGTGFTVVDPSSGFTGAEGYAINLSGSVVGKMTTDNNTSVGFLYSSGQVQNINDLLVDAPGWVVTQANSIADNGLIAATATFAGTSYGVLLTPVPEPATSAAIFAAFSLGLVIWRRTRRRVT